MIERKTYILSEKEVAEAVGEYLVSKNRMNEVTATQKLDVVVYGVVKNPKDGRFYQQFDFSIKG